MESELPAAPAWIMTALAAVSTGLLGVVVWFLHREIKNNDEAHRQLRGDIKTVESDVKKLLEGDVAWVRALLNK